MPACKYLFFPIVEIDLTILTYPNQIDSLLSAASQRHPYNHNVKLHRPHWPLSLSHNLHCDNLVSRPLPASLCAPGQCPPGQLFSLFTFGIVFTGLTSVSTAMTKCSGLLTMVYFALYLNMLTEFIRILDCYIAIVFPFKHQQYITLVCHHHVKLLLIEIILQKNSFAFGVFCWFIVLGISAIFYFTDLSRFELFIGLIY